ncbi:2-succinyl-6-hydroxy-2,4-cyclohexadiene-1-carboxylate synthase [Pseudalkalibacillus hwajinpoensis]|uniref:Putative 2-succinyl-6-hydroxy-2,4-cyclohexadiene-1-carboxylate synthase n=1 Tax=Guptibacillus hwajinpoensis TaxID=208199 RepID=A0A4U1MFV7_9BACL|nr:2-succinyl-6-hydroxy-2,4-cyclohexadiene-1-carboxylate synthase [Pseudalkalibacillus hwajinpoensis]TKD69166.1 2-succinyl-6-hydroxy-2,4-cyclohexadiene-1-carboxylate synthase [Pseudalkalibacillus hwajinpoensis]
MMIGVEDLSFHVEKKGEGETILLLHGFTGSSSNWAGFIDKWSSSFQVIAVDLIGHGKSSKPDDSSFYTMETMSRYLKVLLDHLNVDKIHLLGYSMGGRIALAFAIQYPSMIKSLILESSSPGLLTLEERGERVRKDHALANRIKERGISEFVQFWETIPLFAAQKNLPESVQIEIREQRLQNSEIGLANSLIGMGTGAQPPYWDELEHLEFPVLLMTGELDQKFVSIAKRMKKSLPQADFVQINNIGHTIHVEEPQIFDKMVVAFLKKHADSFL